MEWFDLPEYIEKGKKCWGLLRGFSLKISAAAWVVFFLSWAFYDKIENIMGHVPAWIMWGWGISTFLIIVKIVDATIVPIISPIINRYSQRKKQEKEQEEERRRRIDDDFRYLDMLMSYPIEDAAFAIANLYHSYTIPIDEVLNYIASHKDESWVNEVATLLHEKYPIQKTDVSRLDALAGQG